MLIAFSQDCLPDVGLADLPAAAKAAGFDGVVLHGAYGLFPVGGAREAQLAELAGRFESADVQIAGLHSGILIGSLAAHLRSHAQSLLRSVIDLAAGLKTRGVIVSCEALRDGLTLDRAISEAGPLLAEVAPAAAEHGVQVLIECGGFAGPSENLWQTCDAAGHPAIGVCWNSAESTRAGDVPSIALKRLGGALRMVYLTDPLADGAIDLPRALELLKGLAYGGWLVVHPGALRATPGADGLATAAERLKAELAKPIVPLSAYKGDKNAPRFVAARAKVG